MGMTKKLFRGKPFDAFFNLRVFWLWDLSNPFFNGYLNRFWGYSNLIRKLTMSYNCL
jgi:hypothetical protein